MVVTSPPVSTVTYDVHAVRARFSALRQPLVFFDGPGGTQVPDEVIEAVSRYYRESNANVSGPYETSRKTEALVAQARLTAAEFLGCTPEETTFGANMSTLAFALTRTVGRDWQKGDEIVVTKLDHDANVSPWLELAHDKGLEVRFVDIHDDTTLDLDDLERQLSDRTRVVAFPVASNAVGTRTDVKRIAELAHEAGALAWADAVHYGPHGPIDVGEWDVDVLICSPYKFFGPHLGIAFGRAELLEHWRPYKVRPASNTPLGSRFETGTLPHELLAGFVAAVEYIESIGWDAIRAHERALGERFLAGLPDNVTLYGLPTMDGRVSTFAFNVDGVPAADTAAQLGDAGFAVWHGNYYALEVMNRLDLGDAGAVRAGIVHYNTPEEVDGLLSAIAGL
jgi:cysteine desulfurase family protein (TIGR01976 family)